MIICVIPYVGSAESQLTPSNNAKVGSGDNVLKVKADYVVTIKKKVKVYYKVKTKIKVKVKVRYKSKGKWKTKYKYKYVYKYYYKYYYKYVYTTYNVRDVPPGECTAPTANAQSNDPGIKALAQNLTGPENVTIHNNESAPVAPIEPQAPEYNGSNDQNSQEYLDYINSPEYQQYLQLKQQYDQDYANYQQNLSQYQENITVTRQLTNLEKATNIFNYVRDQLEYSFYYNTQRGAVHTSNDGQGNCCDLSHLIVALSRAAGIPARYVHADCTFLSGNVYGHVWAQLYVDGKWINADASNNINDFGVIRNWNAYTLKGIYSSLPF